jgi:hypothetical protein
VSLALAVFLGSCSAGPSVPPRNTLRLMILSDVECGCKSADIYEPLPATLERFERRSGAHVEVVRLPTGHHEGWMRAAGTTRDAPDVIWTSASGLAPLVREGSLVPLTGWIAHRPMRFQRFPAWIREQFMVGGEIFGVPLAAEGDLRFHAYSMTAAARDRGRADLAFELIAHLGEEIPLRGLPDVALYSLDVHADDAHPERPLEVRVQLKNLGDAPAKRFEVVWRVDGEDVAARRVDGMESGATKELDVELPRKPRREYFIAAVIDPHDLLAESSKVNNSAIGKVTSGLTGPPLAPKALGAPFCIDSAATRTSVWDMGPKVGFDGQNYLVVWARQQTLNGTIFNHELRAARVTPAGQILDPNGIVIAPGPKKYNSFTLAFSGKVFFVAWEVETALGSDPGSVIEGRLISLSASGQLVLGSPVVIENSASPSSDGYPHVKHGGPDVSFTGSEFLVVYKTDENSGAPYVSQWQKAKLGIYARTVSVSGSLPAGKTQLAAYDNALGPVLRPPRVEFAQGTGRVLFTAFSTSNDAYGVYAMGVSVSGGTPVAAAPILIDSVARSVVFSKPAMRWFENPRLAVGWPWYLALHESNIAKPAKSYDPDLYGTVFQAGGAIPKPAPLVQGTLEAWPAVAFDGQNFTLAYQHAVGCQTHLGSVRVNTQGISGAAAIFTSSTFVSDVDLAFGTSNGLAVFWRFNPPSSYNGPDYSEAVCAQFVDKSP